MTLPLVVLVLRLSGDHLMPPLGPSNTFHAARTRTPLRQVALSEIVFAHGLPFTSKSLWTLNVRSTSMTLPLVSLASLSAAVAHS